MSPLNILSDWHGQNLTFIQLWAHHGRDHARKLHIPGLLHVLIRLITECPPVWYHDYPNLSLHGYVETVWLLH